MLELDNPFLCLCEADVDIDGFRVGSWQLGPHEKAVIERPANVAKKFTFLRTKLVNDAHRVGKGEARRDHFRRGQ